jgi:hypothetical protein
MREIVDKLIERRRLQLHQGDVDGLRARGLTMGQVGDTRTVGNVGIQSVDDRLALKVARKEIITEPVVREPLPGTERALPWRIVPTGDSEVSVVRAYVRYWQLGNPCMLKWEDIGPITAISVNDGESVYVGFDLPESGVAGRFLSEAGSSETFHNYMHEYGGGALSINKGSADMSTAASGSISSTTNTYRIYVGEVSVTDGIVSVVQHYNDSIVELPSIPYTIPS